METYEQIVRWIARGVVLLYGVRFLADTRRLAQQRKRPESADQTRQPSASASLSSTSNLAVRTSSPEADSCARWLLGVWLVAFGLHVLHVLLAFAWLHQWSHAEAYEHTAQRTGDVTGWYWGGGVWVNYLFTLLWLADVSYTLRTGITQLPVWYVLLIHGVMLFFLVNATVIFGPAWWSWAAVPLILAGVGWSWYWRQTHAVT